MKRLIASFLMLCGICLSAHAARVMSIRPGETNHVVSGRVLAIEGVTVTANQSMTLKGIASVTELTNATAIVTHPATNYFVCASNVLDSATNVVKFTAPVWREVAWPNQQIIWISTNDVSWAVTNTWTAPKQTYYHTTNIWSGAASDHYIKATPASLYLVGGFLTVTGGKQDRLDILIGD